MNKLSEYAKNILSKVKDGQELDEDEEEFVIDLDGEMDDFWCYISQQNMHFHRAKLFSPEFLHEIKCCVEKLMEAFDLMDKLATCEES